MPQILQPLNNIRSHPILEVYLRPDVTFLLVRRYVSRDAESRSVEGRLGVRVVVEHVEKDLDVALRLHCTGRRRRESDGDVKREGGRRTPSTHDAVCHQQVALVLAASNESGDDGVVRTLVRLLKREKGESVRFFQGRR
jgi:hypothetical protein